MQCEEEERGGDADSDDPDPFIAEGLSTDSDSDSDAGAIGGHARGRNTDGKRFREALKTKLFRAKERRTRRQAARRAEERGL
jgi:hypothetical protein